MKKIITLLTALAVVCACHSTPPASTASPAANPVMVGNQTGAPDPVAAIRAFMAAAKQQDLQAMGALWGDTNGPARDAISRDELEKRELIMVTCLKHDRYDIAGDAPSPGGGRAMIVNLTFKDVSRSSNFLVVQGPGNRWYVQKFDLAALEPICAKR